jgi:dihydropteroate synthase
MAILNVTPESFSDGGRYASAREAVARAWEVVEQGANLLDVGGESTRPGSDPIAPDEERARVLPVIRELVEGGYPIPIGIDTTKADVARACLDAGARILNDVSALRDDPAMLDVAARSGAAVILMHRLGTSKTMQVDPVYRDVVGEVAAFLAERVRVAIKGGVARERLLVDPGIGFGKTVEHNLALIGTLDRIAAAAGVPVMLGASRKRFLGALLGNAASGERLEGSLAAVAAAAWQGAEVVRVHDVWETARLLRVLRPILAARKA